MFNGELLLPVLLKVRYDRIPEAFRGLCRAFPENELMGRLDTLKSHALMDLLATRCGFAGQQICTLTLSAIAAV